MNEKAPKKTCGARNRQGQPCKKAPMRGRTRCRNHGGATPKGNRNAVTHGLYAQPTAEQRADFERHFRMLMSDPKTAVAAMAANICTQVERVQRSAPDGVLRLETTRKTIKGDAWSTDDGMDVPAGEVETERTEKHVDITGPMADALAKAARITTAAYDIPMTVAKTKMLEAGQDPDANKTELHVHVDAVEE